MEQEYKALKKEVEKSFKKIWGPRCKTSDLVDFPELKKQPESRCMVCLSYEKLDNFLADLQKSL